MPVSEYRKQKIRWDYSMTDNERKIAQTTIQLLIDALEMPLTEQTYISKQEAIETAKKAFVRLEK